MVKMSLATRRADLGDLGRLVPGRPVDRRLVVVDAPHATEVDELDRVAGLDHVVRLEVAVQQPLRVQIRERREDLDDVGDRLVGGDRVVPPVVRGHPILEDLLQRATADVLHDDVAGAVEAREVVDLEDERVLHLGEEPTLGDRGLERVLVAGVQQALEHDVPVRHVAVVGEIDPAEPAVRDAADHCVLPADQITRVQLRREASTASGTSGRTPRSDRRRRRARARRGLHRPSRTASPPAPTGWPGRWTAGRRSARRERW